MPINDTLLDFNHNNNIILDSYDNTHPEFDNSTERDVIAAVGTTARLHCRVRNLGDRAVSWIRKRDLHILTIGIMTYTNDQRFLARHIDNSDEWVLKIVSVQPRDAGVYECQVSVEPKISQAYKLMVVSKYNKSSLFLLNCGTWFHCICIVCLFRKLRKHKSWPIESCLCKAAATSIWPALHLRLLGPTLTCCGTKTVS